MVSLQATKQKGTIHRRRTAVGGPQKGLCALKISRNKEAQDLVTSQKRNISPFAIFKKRSPLTFYLWVLYPGVPKFWPTNPKFSGNFESEVRSGFRARNGELKGSGVAKSEGDNSPFRGARLKNFIFGFPVPETPLHTFFATHRYFLADLPNRTVFRPGPVLLFRPETEFPAEIGVGWSKLGAPGHIYPEIKGRWLILFDFRGGEINFWFVKT